MKKRILALIVTLFCAMFVIAGCVTEGPEVTPGPTEKPIDWFTLCENKTTNFVIVNYLTDPAAANSLAKTLRIKFGTDVPVVDESKAGTNAIYLGTAEQLAGKGGTSTKITYTGYEVAMDENNIYIAISSETYAEEIINTFKAQILKIEDGKYGIDKAYAGIKNVANITEAIPEFQTTSARLYDIHDSGSGNFLLTYQLLRDKNDVLAYEKTLEDAGFTLHSFNEINNNRFATYLKGDTMIHCTYFPARYEYRIVYGPKTYLGPTEAVTGYENVVTPSITLFGLSDSGLCMVAQLPDGSFVVIDGGWGTKLNRSITLNSGKPSEYTFNVVRNGEKDMHRLYQFLTENNPNGGLPKVTWMITHCDPDHITMPTNFLKEYAGKIDLINVCYNFPNMHNIKLGEGSSTNDPNTFTAYWQGFVNNAAQYFPNANHIITHTGQKLYLPGCEIEFLFNAAEDYYPAAMNWCNHTSNAWRMTIAGKTIMVTGDIESGLCTKMHDVYGSYLKSDILQVVHHGSNGATLDFYKDITPEVCLWPCLDEYLKYDLRHTGVTSTFNKYLHDVAKAHYSGSNNTTILLPSLEVKK